MYKLMKENLIDIGAPNFCIGVYSTLEQAESALATWLGCPTYDLLYIVKA